MRGDNSVLGATAAAAFLLSLLLLLLLLLRLLLFDLLLERPDLSAATPTADGPLLSLNQGEI